MPEAAAWANITEAQIAEIGFDGLPGDDDIVAPLAPPNLDPAQTRELAAQTGFLAAGKTRRLGAEHSQSGCRRRGGRSLRRSERIEIARLVFRQISSAFEPAVARQALAWIILSPEDGQAVTRAPELGLFRHPPERLVRQRSVIYAEKYLGRLLGKIPD